MDLKENSFIIVERQKNQPVLLRDFPLIGSENFHFPFFLDGFKFNPFETRNGLYLNGNLNDEAIENRKILEKAYESGIEFIKYIIDQTKSKLYLLAKSNIPEAPQKYDKFALEWFINQQIIWRKKLLELKLLRDDDNSFSEIKEIKIPLFNKDFNEDFYNLIKKINLTDGILPKQEDIKNWYEIMEKDPLKEVYNIEKNTWGFNYLFTEEDLFKKIEEYKNINEFADKFQKTTTDILDWFNNLYELLNKNNKRDYLNTYNMIPNQKGIFKKGNEIFGNDNNKEDKIPDIINLLYKEINNEDVYDIIVHENINLKNLDKFINKKNLENIFNEFSLFIKDENKDINKKKLLCEQFISFPIKNDKIKQMFNFNKIINFNCETSYIENYLPYYNEKHNLWKVVEDFWFAQHSKIIEKFENIDNLSKKLFNNEIRKEETYKWLNDYIKFIKENCTLIEYKKIFPDRNGNFKYLDELRSASDIPEILIDYENELKRIQNKNFDRRNELLSNKIEIFKGYNRISQKEIISEI